MRYWWVNQNQTYRHEVPGGFLWSPKRNQGNRLNPFYEFMREVAPGDLVFSFCNTRIRAFGIAQSHAYECPKPDFGGAGRNWEDVGWRVDVRFHEVTKPVRPKDWIALLAPLLPAKHSPLQRNGNGVQSIYLTALPETLVLALADLIGAEVGALARAELIMERAASARPPDVQLWEDQLERACRVTRVDRPEHLPRAAASLGATTPTRSGSTGRTGCC